MILGTMANSRIKVYLLIALDEYHPVCRHGALDASPMLLILVFIQSVVCRSTKRPCC